MQIIDLQLENKDIVRQAAELLVEGFKEHWSHAWPDMEAALKEVGEVCQPENINRIALDDEGRVVGWIGGIHAYDGNAWELHPLVVHPEQQGQGIGRALVEDFEKQVAERGGITVYLGTDDEDNMTSLSNVDLYPNVAEHLSSIRNLRRHPFEFYQKMGYTVVGVIPDANGLGKPDILMAKRVGK